MVQYAWPGNIRELRNVLERVQLVAVDAEEVRAAHLPQEIRGGSTANYTTAEETALTLAEMERRHIARVLAHYSGNRSRAARALGISRATLYEKLDRYGLDEVGRASSGRRSP
jgi:two-component system NtrC family response regulator